MRHLTKSCKWVVGVVQRSQIFLKRLFILWKVDWANVWNWCVVDRKKDVLLEVLVITNLIYLRWRQTCILSFELFHFWLEDRFLLVKKLVLGLQLLPLFHKEFASVFNKLFHVLYFFIVVVVLLVKLIGILAQLIKFLIYLGKLHLNVLQRWFVGLFENLLVVFEVLLNKNFLINDGDSIRDLTLPLLRCLLV